MKKGKSGSKGKRAEKKQAGQKAAPKSPPAKQQKKTQQTKASSQNSLTDILFWAPRILAIIIVLWWMFFVFASHGLSTVAIIESIVWLAPLAATVIAWRFPTAGGTIFILYGILYIWAFRTRANPSAYLFISAPLILTGLLFWLSRMVKN